MFKDKSEVHLCRSSTPDSYNFVDEPSPHSISRSTETLKPDGYDSTRTLNTNRAPDTPPESIPSHNCEVLARISSEMPESPMQLSESADDWALSSACPDVLSESEDELSCSQDDGRAPGDSGTCSDGRPVMAIGGPAFVLPRLLIAQSSQTIKPRSFGKLRVLVIGEPNSGKTSLISALIKEAGGTSVVSANVGDRSLSVTEKSFSLGESKENDSEQNVALLEAGLPGDIGQAQYGHLLSVFLEKRFAEVGAVVNGANPHTTTLLSHVSSLWQFPHIDLIICTVECPAPGQLVKTSQGLEDDLAYLAELSVFAPISVVLTKCDLQKDNLCFRRALVDALSGVQLSSFMLDEQGLPFAISTRATPNYDMTLSAVEAPGYRSTLFSSGDLSSFVERLFNQRSAFRLRTLSAECFVDWIHTNYCRRTLRTDIGLGLLGPGLCLDLPTSPGWYLTPSLEGEMSILNSRSRERTPKARKSPRGSARASRRRQMVAISVDPLGLCNLSTAIKALAVVAAVLVGVRVLYSLPSYVMACWQPPTPPESKPSLPQRCYRLVDAYTRKILAVG